MTLTLVQYLLGIGSGALVGFVLGLVGGGGSILAVPLMVYLVGVKSPHMAIGTSAFAVAANAATGLLHHARAGHVKWRCAAVFAVAVVAGAALGSTTGQDFPAVFRAHAFSKPVFSLLFEVRRLLKRKGHTDHPFATFRGTSHYRDAASRRQQPDHPNRRMPAVGSLSDLSV